MSIQKVVESIYYLIINIIMILISLIIFFLLVLTVLIMILLSFVSYKNSILLFLKITSPSFISLVLLQFILNTILALPAMVYLA